MTSTVATRLSELEVKEIEQLAENEDLDKSTFLKKLLHKGLSEYKVEYAFRLYKEKKISLGKVAEISGLSIWRIIGLLKQHDVTLNYDLEDLKHDIKAGN